MHYFKGMAISTALLAVIPTAGLAQELIGSYVAHIGREDLYNSSGARLSEPWQIIRQDRANFHRFGIRHAGDEWDSFFGDIDNRAAMERMIMNGSINPVAARDIVSGGATVVVEVWGYGDTGNSVRVDVYR
ncbi:hypothetical protein [Aliiroseovarius sp.]|uniref:hypothetical protein n=1 Tax=Aliiroseovarius sp. TaxID=1872442 RepID=UPI0026039A4A|nr:hypothetical protein [Aliiroseovarius sp.]